MKYVPIIIIVILAGTQVYTFTQLNRLTSNLSAAEADIVALDGDLEAASAELGRLVQENASGIKAANEKTASGVEALENRLNALEPELRDDVTAKLTKDLVDAATSKAIERTIFEHLPKSEEFLVDLAGVLAQNFQKELQGIPGEKVDPELLSTFLVRDESFLDAMRFEILIDNTAGQ